MGAALSLSYTIPSPSFPRRLGSTNIFVTFKIECTWVTKLIIRGSSGSKEASANVCPLRFPQRLPVSPHPCPPAPQLLTASCKNKWKVCLASGWRKVSRVLLGVMSDEGIHLQGAEEERRARTGIPASSVHWRRAAKSLGCYVDARTYDSIYNYDGDYYVRKGA